MTQIYEAEPREIVVENRIRKTFDPKEMKKLEASIAKHGQLQPGVCMRGADGQPVLCAGERRLRACQAIGSRFLYILKDEIEDETTLREVELEENLNRSDLTWLEEAQGVLEYFELLDLPMEAAAERLGMSYGSFQSRIELARFARELPAVRAAKTFQDAKKEVAAAKDQLQRAVLLQKARKDAVDAGYAPPDILERPYMAGDLDRPASGVDDASLAGELSDEEKAHLREGIIAGHEKQEAIADLKARYRAEMQRRCLLGNMEEVVPTLEPFDIVFFDPPWGVEVLDVQRSAVGKLGFDDQKDILIENLERWLRILWSAMCEDSHLYLVYPITQTGFVYDTLESVGFSTNRIPIIWSKAGARATRNPDIWPGRCYEPVAFARKGDKRLSSKRLGAPAIIETPQPTAHMKQIHPSVKHPDLWKELLIRSARPGDRVLDPMSGGGMVGVAAESLQSELQLYWIMIEKERMFRDLGVLNVLKGLEEVLASEAKASTGAPDEDDTYPPPGSPQWKALWINASDEEQEAMLAWRRMKGETRR